MDTKSVILEIPDWIANGLVSGDYIRTGGEIREAGTMKLVAFLKETDAQRLGMDNLLSSTSIPLVVQGVSTGVLEKRLRAIEAKLDRILSEMREIHLEQEYQSILAEASLLGRATGTLHALSFVPLKSLCEGRADDFLRDLLPHHSALLFAARRIGERPEILKKHGEAFYLLAQSGCLCGVAARDLLVRIGREDDAVNLSRTISEEATSLRGAIEGARRRPSSLFWFSPDHFEALAGLREADDRLASHLRMLETVPFKDILALKPMENERLG